MAGYLLECKSPLILVVESEVQILYREARVVDDNMNDVQPGESGELLVKGPSMFRYLPFLAFILEIFILS